MSPEEKASEIVQSITDAFIERGCRISKPAVIAAALIVVSEVHLNGSLIRREDYKMWYQYWQLVKTEIETL
jgi:hypothetical protein